MRLWLLYQKYRRSKLCGILTCSNPVIEAKLRHLSATRHQSPFAILSDSSPCYRKGHFAFWFYSSVLGNSSLSDTELGFGKMTVLSPILWCPSSFGLMPLLINWPFGLSFVVHQCSCSSIFCWYSCKVVFPASFLQAYSHSGASVIAYVLPPC